MDCCKLENLEITFGKQGADRFAKVSYPIRYGRFCEIKTPGYLFQLNLNGEIKYIRGLNGNWPHPAEWLKRTDADDWVFYSVGEYNKIFSLLGEYYLPYLPYSSNSIWQHNPFADPTVAGARRAWCELQARLCSVPLNGASAEIKNFLNLAALQDAAALRRKSQALHRIIGAQLSVLPPDTRHVDYEIIPLVIADGCLYHCSFCCVKSRRGFSPRSKENILTQIRRLKAFYGSNLSNYNALFLGNHDGLAAGCDLVSTAAAEAYAAFDLENSHIKDPALFLFGSVDSLLNAQNRLFENLDQIPMNTYINIGFESADKDTLAQINKPLSIQKICDAFQKMLALNRGFANIEVTANFLLGDRLSAGHHDSIIELVRNGLERIYSKGGVYLSPLTSSRNKHDLLRTFYKIKNLSRLPVYLYLLQRL